MCKKHKELEEQLQTLFSLTFAAIHNIISLHILLTHEKTCEQTGFSKDVEKAILDKLEDIERVEDGINESKENKINVKEIIANTLVGNLLMIHVLTEKIPYIEAEGRRVLGDEEYESTLSLLKRFKDVAYNI